MLTNDEARRLHDRATRGESLNDQERAQLSEWYEKTDREELAALGNVPPSSATDLRKQTDAAAAHIADVARRIQALTSENEQLRDEIAELRRKLAARGTAQPV